MLQAGQSSPSHDDYYGSLGRAPVDGMIVANGPQEGNAKDYSGILHAMKRHMSMLRLRRANRELR